jgi:hypothetical protein
MCPSPANSSSYSFAQVVFLAIPDVLRRFAARSDIENSYEPAAFGMKAIYLL